nr:helix-turn-helix domain-containing protein [Anaerosphaera multitolerans]
METMRNENLTYSETLSKFNIPSHSTIIRWKRIYLEEGKEALHEERRGRSKVSDGVRKGRLKKLSKEITDDLIKENQRLKMENEYLKKLDALIRSKQNQQKKK